MSIYGFLIVGQTFSQLTRGDGDIKVYRTDFTCRLAAQIAYSKGYEVTVEWDESR